MHGLERLLEDGGNRRSPFSIRQGRKLGSPFRENRGSPFSVRPGRKLGSPCGGSGGSPCSLIHAGRPGSNSSSFLSFSNSTWRQAMITVSCGVQRVHFLYMGNYTFAPSLRHLFYHQLRPKGENKSTNRVFPRKNHISTSQYIHQPKRAVGGAYFHTSPQRRG
jgi:hypothetical protein